MELRSANVAPQSLSSCQKRVYLWTEWNTSSAESQLKTTYRARMNSLFVFWTFESIVYLSQISDFVAVATKTGPAFGQLLLFPKPQKNLSWGSLLFRFCDHCIFLFRHSVRVNDFNIVAKTSQEKETSPSFLHSTNSDRDPTNHLDVLTTLELFSVSAGS